MGVHEGGEIKQKGGVVQLRGGGIKVKGGEVIVLEEEKLKWRLQCQLG